MCRPVFALQQHCRSAYSTTVNSMASNPSYKKRVIEESDSEGDDVPLAKSANMGKTASNGSNHDPETVAEGSALLKSNGKVS